MLNHESGPLLFCLSNAFRRLQGGVIPAALLALALPFAPFVANATVCTEPVEPVCAGMKQTFKDEALIIRCRNDIDSHLEEVKKHTACLREKADETEKAAEQLEKRFQSSTKEAKETKEGRK